MHVFLLAAVVENFIQYPVAISSVSCKPDVVLVSRTLHGVVILMSAVVVLKLPLVQFHVNDDAKSFLRMNVALSHCALPV